MRTCVVVTENNKYQVMKIDFKHTYESLCISFFSLRRMSITHVLAICLLSLSSFSASGSRFSFLLLQVVFQVGVWM